MAQLAELLKKAQRRRRIVESLAVVPWPLALGFFVAGCMWMSPRVWGGPEFEWWCFAPVVISLLVPLWAFVRFRSDDTQEALHIDQKLGLKELLSTGWHARNQNEPFAKQVANQADVEAARASVMLSRLYPLPWSRRWIAPLAVLALGLASWQWVPYDAFGIISARDKASKLLVAQAQAREKAKLIAKQALERAKQSASPEAEELRRDLEELKNKELKNKDDAQKLAMASFNLQKQLDADQKARQDAMDKLMAKMSKLAPRDDIAKDMAAAMRRGDFEKAAEELGKMMSDAKNGKLNPAQMSALSQALAQMSQQLNSQSQSNQAQANQNPGQSGNASNQQQQADARDKVLKEMQKVLEDAGVVSADAKRIAEETLLRAEAGQTGSALRQPTAHNIGQAGQAQSSSIQLADEIATLAEDFVKNKQSQSSCSSGSCNNPGQQGQQNSQSGSSSSSSGTPSSQNMATGNNGSNSGMTSQQLSQALQQMANQCGSGQCNGSASQQSMQQALNALKQASGQCNGGSGSGSGSRSGSSSFGVGAGPGAGHGSGGPLFSGNSQDYQNSTQSHREMRQPLGAVVLPGAGGLSVGGSSNMKYSDSVSQGKQQAERALNESRVPTRLHGSIRDYFRQLPEQQQP